MPLTALLHRYDRVLLDLDGCLWVGEDATPGAVEAVAALREAGKDLAFVTNDARHGGEDFVRKLWGLGFRAALEEVVTVGGALQFELATAYGERGGTAVVIGSAAVHRHVHDAGLRVVNGTAFAPRADVVVIAAHDDFSYRELKDATQAALRGAELLVAGRDATFPMPDGPWPGTGPVVAAVETASGRTARSVGKPEPDLLLTALDRLGGGPERTLMIGDRVDVDLGAAVAAGVDGAIVLTGAGTQAEAALADPAPVAVAASLAELVLR